MNKNRLLPSLRSLILPLTLAATPLTALAWPTLTIPTNALQADAVQAFSGDALGAFELAEIKTKQLAGILDKLEVARGSLIVDGPNDKLRMSARNLDGHQVLPPEGVNVYDVLRHEHLVLTKSAAQALEARLKG